MLQAINTWMVCVLVMQAGKVLYFSISGIFSIKVSFVDEDTKILEG